MWGLDGGVTLYRVVFLEKVGCQNAPTVVLGGAGCAGEVGVAVPEGARNNGFAYLVGKVL